MLRRAERSVLKQANELTEEVVKRKDLLPSDKTDTINQIKEQVKSVVEQIHGRRHPEAKVEKQPKSIELNDSPPETLGQKMQA